MAVFKSLLLALCLTLCLVANSNASDTKWAITDSLPSLYYSYGAYCDPAYLSNWTCGFCKHNPGTQVVGLLEDWLTSTFGYVAISGNEVVVVYRGSECIMNWINNINFWWTAYPRVPNAYVHRGFWNAYQTVQSQTQKQVAAALAKCPSCRTIRCTGHSLGAALATHAAVDLSFIYKANTTAPAIKLTTFGSPRVGDLVFSTYVQNQMKASWRTHYCDPVPHLPPTLKEINWHHVATEIYEGKDANSYKQCNGSGEDPSCADGILLPFKPSDHLDYMGVSVEAGKAQTCQTHGADCSVFMAKWMELNNRP